MPESSTRDQTREAAGAASDRGREVAEHAKGQASEVTADAKQQAGAVVGEARQRAKSVLDDAAGQARTQADDQARRMVPPLRGAGQQLHAMANGESTNGALVDLARSAGDWVEDLAGRLDEGGLRGTMDEVTRFARRRPGTFLLGAGVAGFVAGRVFRNADTQELKEAVKGEAQPGQSGQSGAAGQGPSVDVVPEGAMAQIESPANAALPEAGTATPVTPVPGQERRA